MIHTGFWKGKRVYAITKDGKSYIGKFLESNRTHLVLDNIKIALKDLRSATIYKGEVKK